MPTTGTSPSTRYNIMLNGGQSGDGSVAGFVGKTPAGFYDAEGNVVESTFTSAAPADTLADLTAADMATPADAGDWIIDDVRSRLNADAEGNLSDAGLRLVHL